MDRKIVVLWNVKRGNLRKLLHSLGGAYFLSLQDIRENREDKKPMLWEWIRGAKVFGQKWETEDQAAAFIQRTGKFGYVGRNKKAR